MKAFSTIKSAFAVACALSCVFNSCVEETLHITEKEEVEILNNLALSTGKIKRGTENALNPELTLTQETTNVENFDSLTYNPESSQFSDGQEASLKVTTEGSYKVENISYRDYSVEEYSPHRRKVTLNFAVKYSFDGEVRDTVLSPWYFQEKPEVTPQQPPQADVMSVSAFVKVINNGNGSQTAFPEVNFYKNGELDHSYKCVVNLVKTGQVMGAEVHTTSTSCINEVMECDTLSIEEKVIKDVFKTVTETRLYRLERSFETASGGVISPKNEIKFVLCREITFEAEGEKFSWFFHGGENFTWGFHGNSDTSIGKEIEGTFSPYLGAYTINQEVYVSSFSPQVEGLNGGEPFFSTKAEYHLYKRERVE
jgi:hypothetical protein